MNAPPRELPPVVVTRAEPQDGPLSSYLKNLGLRVLLWPAVSVTPADPTALRQELDRVKEFDWIVFTSRHAVDAVITLLPQKPEGVRIAAVGQATAQVLRQRGWDVDLLPEEANAAALVNAFAAHVRKGTRVLYPASSRALPTLKKGLTGLGAEVTQVEAYRTDAAPLDVENCRAWINRESVGAVTFASPSAVVELERALGRADFDRLLDKAASVAIGPTTARALKERGRTPVVAESATLEGLANTTFKLLQTRH
ncbi:MAG TPA: uroporphyrinogen-III synthase [Steroidobacteraceae bacterium]